MQVAGYFKGVMGTGEHGRALVAALRTEGIAVTATTLHPEAAPEDDALVSFESSARTASGPPGSDQFERFSLLCANADAVPRIADRLGEEFFAGRYTIGFWAWEVSTFPLHFLPAFECLDEVWVGSRHVRDAVAAIAPVPVLAIPQPVSLAPDATGAAPPPGLPGGFRFLFAFDYLSVFERKNPLATIEAFARAFEPGSGASLIIKSLNHERDAPAHERLRASAAAHPDVHLIERRLSRPERDGLLNAAGCYVSLHRAEGFGYTLAEAMWLGKPVIATGYSGNLEFMTTENSYLVDNRLVPIGPGNDPYPADAVWAEPDVDHAAVLMRSVFEQRDEAARRAERGAAGIRDSHSPEAGGRAMAQRLGLLSANVSDQPAQRPRIHSTDWAHELIRSGPVRPGRPKLGAAQRIGRNALLRLLKPLIVHERLVAGELLQAIEALEARVQSLTLSHQQALRRIEQLESELRSRPARERDPGPPQATEQRSGRS